MDGSVTKMDARGDVNRVVEMIAQYTAAGNM